METSEESEIIPLDKVSLVRSRSSLFDYITKGPDNESLGVERFQSDLKPYREESNAILALVKGVRNPKRPTDINLS